MGVLSELPDIKMDVFSELPEIYRISALLLLGTSIFFLINQSAKPKANFPFVGTWSSDFVSRFFGGFKFVIRPRSMIDKGYSKYPDTPFQIPTILGARIILPPKHVEELRSYPDSKLSFTASVYEFMQGKNIGIPLMGEENTPHTKLIRSQLTSNLARLVDPIADEAKYAFDAEIGPAKEWKSICLHSALVRIIARVSSRIFVGEEICRREEWIQASIKFTENIFGNIIFVTPFPRFLRPLATFFLPFRRRVHHHRKVSRKLLGPVYEQRLADQEAGKPRIEDAFGWMVSNAQPKWRNVNDLVDFHLFLAMASVHTTTAALDSTVYDLIARPEYIEPLREEIIQSVTEDGGQLKKSTLAKMMKLDSFMKETQRLNSALLSFGRKALEPLDLSDGTHIPAGSKVAAPSYSLNFDPKYFENPEEFDGYRFYKMRQQVDEFNRHQYVSTSTSELNFGYGSHTCPGRFFAANELKILLVRLLMKYELKYPEGQGRPKNWSMAEMNQPSKKVNVLIRERTDVPNWDFL